MLELKNVCWSAPDGREVLHDVSLKVEDPCIMAITGPNGGGKTSLARIIMGIEQPTGGHIFLDGKDITGLDVTERARQGISFAFQQPVRFKGITVRRMLEIAAKKTLDQHTLCEYLRKVGLCAQDYIDREIDATLSGGEIKRIELASVLARKSRLTVLDEPEAGIDLWSFENLIKTFEEIRRDLAGSLIIISHQERILRIADRIVLLKNGSVAQEGFGPIMMEKLMAQERSGAKCCGKGETFYGSAQ